MTPYDRTTLSRERTADAFPFPELRPCIDVVQHFDFCTGNAIKYLWRAGLKPGADRVEDLRKAAWYVQRAIAMAEQENANGCK